MTKYNTLEEKKEAQQKRSKEYYERNKNNPEFIERRRECFNRYYDKNRDMVNEKAKAYYHKNNDYRCKKIDDIKQKYHQDENFKDNTINQAKTRYWKQRSRILELENMLLSRNTVSVNFK